MSTPPEPDAESPTRPEPPDVEELARIATPATVRRAPRYRAFVFVGVVLGIVVAFFLVILGAARDAAEASSLGSGPVFVFVALTFGVLGALLGAIIALLLDRRSRH